MIEVSFSLIRTKKGKKQFTVMIKSQIVKMIKLIAENKGLPVVLFPG